MRKRLYVLDKDLLSIAYNNEEEFFSDRMKYNKFIGPFRTKASALYYIKYLSSNPHIGCVADAELVFKRSKDIKYVGMEKVCI